MTLVGNPVAEKWGQWRLGAEEAGEAEELKERGHLGGPKNSPKTADWRRTERPL